MSSGREPFGFDIDPFEPDYGVRFPGCVSIVDTSKIQGQIALFDQLLRHNEITKIVDVRHRFYQEFLTTIDEIGFIEEADAARVEPIFVFHSGEAELSRRESHGLMRRWPKLCLIGVLNKGAVASAAMSPRALPEELPSSKKLTIGALDSVARTCFEAFDFSLSEFLRTPPLEMSFVTHMALRIWTKAVFDQIRRLEM